MGVPYTPALLSLWQTTIGLEDGQTEWWWLLNDMAPTMPSKSHLVVGTIPKFSKYYI